jgi:hypothetical protein
MLAGGKIPDRQLLLCNRKSRLNIPLEDSSGNDSTELRRKRMENPLDKHKGPATVDIYNYRSIFHTSILVRRTDSNELPSVICLCPGMIPGACVAMIWARLTGCTHKVLLF